MESARVILKSFSPAGVPITTFKLRYPKMIHGELMTHRVLSRNASSSRAIPTAKYLEEVRSRELRAAPAEFGKNGKGMQSAGALDEYARTLAEAYWDEAACNAADVAENMAAAGVHKQFVNRILDPFVHINVIATGTDWRNFFGLRLDAAADPTMRSLAEAMWRANREPERVAYLDPGQWHLPFVDQSDRDFAAENARAGGLVAMLPEDLLVRVSVARCARISYESFETGRRSAVEEDLRLYDRLLAGSPIHASPAEHQATPDRLVDVMGRGEWSNPAEWGNFFGWRQHRKMIPGEALAPLPEGREWREEDGR